jgi:hypothetical protein
MHNIYKKMEVSYSEIEKMRELKKLKTNLIINELYYAGNKYNYKKPPLII